MNTPLTLVEPLDPVLTQRAHEDALINEALQLLDQRYFQRGEVLITPADAASYLKLRLAPYHHEVFALLYLDSQHRVLTARLIEILALVEVRVLDHIIVGEGQPLSLAEYGWI